MGAFGDNAFLAALEAHDLLRVDAGEYLGTVGGDDKLSIWKGIIQVHQHPLLPTWVKVQVYLINKHDGFGVYGIGTAVRIGLGHAPSQIHHEGQQGAVAVAELGEVEGFGSARLHLQGDQTHCSG